MSLNLPRCILKENRTSHAMPRQLMSTGGGGIRMLEARDAASKAISRRTRLHK